MTTELDRDPAAGIHTEQVARMVHPRAIRWLHWINFPLLVIMIWSGLRIYWAEDVYAFGIGSWQWFAFFPEWLYEQLDLERRLARGMAFHFAFGWLFVINGVIYAAYLARSGEWRTILPDRRSAGEAKDVVLHDLHVRRRGRRVPKPPQGVYNAAQRWAYTTVLVMAALVVVSGFAIYKPTQLHPLPLLFGGYQGARLVHFTMTIGIVLFFLVHLLQVIRAGWGNFRSMLTGYELVEVGRCHDEVVSAGGPPPGAAEGEAQDVGAVPDDAVVSAGGPPPGAAEGEAQDVGRVPDDEEVTS